MNPKPFKTKKSPYYQFRFRMDGRRRQRTTREVKYKKAVKVVEEAFEAAKVRSRGDEPEPTTAGAVAQWVQTHLPPVRSESHVDAVRRFGEQQLGPLADLLLSRVTTKLVEEARRIYLEQHAPSSANQWLTYLKLVFKWAKKRKMIKFMPWDVAEIKIQEKPKRLLPKSRTAQFLQEVDRLTAQEPALALCIRMEMALGLRGQEVREARWEWLDMERLTYTPGGTKGKEAWSRPVPDWVIAVLGPGSRKEGLMLPTHSGARLTWGRVQRVIDAACAAVGIARLTGHRLRGTYATLLAEKGVPMKDIQRALGHKDIRTTQGYIEPDLDRVVHAQRSIAQDLGFARTSAKEPSK